MAIRGSLGDLARAWGEVEACVGWTVADLHHASDREWRANTPTGWVARATHRDGSRVPVVAYAEGPVEALRALARMLENGGAN